jgi:hypothetical protein
MSIVKFYLYDKEEKRINKKRALAYSIFLVRQGVNLKDFSLVFRTSFLLAGTFSPLLVPCRCCYFL